MDDGGKWSQLTSLRRLQPNSPEVMLNPSRIARLEEASRKELIVKIHAPQRHGYAIWSRLG